MLKANSLRTQKAYGYIRVSSVGQLKGYGPQRQREDIQAYAKANGFELANFFEEAFTGVESDRPAFMKMLSEMMEGTVRVVIVESLDRFARELMVQTVLLAKLASCDVRLIAANTGIDVTAEMTKDPMRKAMIRIQVILAELDKDLLVKKLRRGREAKKAATGRCEGRKPFGFYPHEASTLQRIQKLRRKPRMGERLSYQGIADALNSESIPTRSGSKWSPSTVQQICKARGWT